MLSTIREKTQGWIAAIILGLLAIPFALWGINYYFEGGAVKVADVNGQEISVDSYRRTLDEQRRSLQQMLGRGADARLFDTPEFRQRVLEGMVDEILLSQDVQGQGYRVSKAELARQIRQAPQFQRDGRFDPKLYELLLRNAGMDARGFEGNLMNDVLMRQAQSGYGESVIVTNTDLTGLLRLQAQEREATIAILRPAQVRNRVQLGSGAVEQEYQQNADRYRTPDQVRIEYIRLSVENLAKDIQVSRDDLNQALAEAQQVAVAQQERRASHILIKLAPGADAATEKAAMAKIQGLRARLQAGASFADVARQNSEDPGSAAQGGDLGPVARGVMAKEFEQALFALGKPGELSAPVRTQYGLHLIKLTGLKSGAKPVVNRATLEVDLRARKAEQRFFELSERFHNLVYEQPDSLKPAAETLGLKVETSGWFTRAGSGSGITAAPKVIEAAFDPEVLEQGRNSQVIEISPNTLIALRVHAHEAPRQRPLNEVRDEIEKTLLVQAQKQEVERLVQEALRKLNEGASFEAVARQYGMEIRATQRYGRKATGLDGQLLLALFKAAHPAPGKTVTGMAVQTDGGMALFAFKRVIEPDQIDTAGTDAQALRRSLESRRGREQFGSYRAGLREQASVKTYQDQL
jgi:peptidyl-prolyl cis-trans isomerase D